MNMEIMITYRKNILREPMKCASCIVYEAVI